MLFCHGCYERHHLLSKCTTNITDVDRIVSHFESLTADEKARVAEKYYLMDRAATTGTSENELLKEVKKA